MIRMFKCYCKVLNVGLFFAFLTVSKRHFNVDSAACRRVKPQVRQESGQNSSLFEVELPLVNDALCQHTSEHV
jgi:hypothetical protein